MEALYTLLYCDS